MKTVCYIDASNLMKNGYDVDHRKLFGYLKKDLMPIFFILVLFLLEIIIINIIF